MKKLSPILLLFLAALGCKYLSPAQKLESEAATENPKRTLTDSPIWINNDSVGTISGVDRKKTMGDPASLIEPTLRERLGDITKQRELNGVFNEGTDEIAANVYLIANPELAIGPFAKLFIAAAESAGDIYIPKKNIPAHDRIPRHPDPMFLAVTTEKLNSETLMPALYPTYDPNHRYTYDTSFEFVKSADSLLSDRAWAGSVEISADERYFINDAQGKEADNGPKYTQVKQRPIEAAALKDELVKIVSANKEILIIASEKASYKSLLRLFEEAESMNVALRVLVRGQFEK